MQRVGVDVGGTFTDVVAVTPEGIRHVKVLTRPGEPWASVVEGIERLGVKPGVVVHATTLATNMLFGQVGLEKPRVALVTNRGFRDVVEIGRQNRPVLYDLWFRKPEPLVPRHLRFEIRGRVDAKGRILEDIDEREVEELARKLCSLVDVVVVVLLHSYANPVHELRVKRVFERICPRLTVVASHEVDPRPREYERSVTAVIAGILRPMVARYLGMLSEALSRLGVQTLLVMQSSGGVAPPDEVVEKPVGLIESGPAAGAVAAAYISRIASLGDLVAFDMGGTTAKASLIVNGEPLVTDEYEVGGRVHRGVVVKGSGYPLRTPHVDVVEVGAGGGTIAWVDEGGALRLGPLSAGADPGPACYARGGRDATITDAHAVLGRLPEVLGGVIRVDKSLALRAYERLAERLGVSVERVAETVIQMANVEMARAVRIASLERGVDPRRLTLLAYGGAGPLHATGVAEEVGIERVAVPPYAGVFSALGLLVADYRYDRLVAVEELVEHLSDNDVAKMVSSVINDVESRPWVERLEGRVYTATLGMRYRGQAYEIEVPWRGSLSEALREFHDRHEALYGFKLLNHPVVLAYIRVTLRAPTRKPRLRAPQKTTPTYTTRRVYFEGHGWLEARVYKRESLPAGFRVKPPAIIEALDTTILVPPGWEASVEEHGVLILERV